MPQARRSPRDPPSTRRRVIWRVHRRRFVHGCGVTLAAARSRQKPSTTPRRNRTHRARIGLRQFPLSVNASECAMHVHAQEKRKESSLAETGRVVVQAILIALVIRALLFQAFNIPSGSMKDTLLVGDYLFVSQFSYGYSRYSLPFSLPLFSGRIFGSEPKRGDVVVFALPRDPSTDYIKRVIGLPGDRIQMIGGLLHINGAPVKRERVSDFIDDENGGAERVRRWRETLPNGVTYETLDLQDNGFLDN